MSKPESVARKNYYSLLLLLLFLLSSVSNVFSDDSCTLWGQVVDKDLNPRQGVRITVFSKEQAFHKTLVSDKSGYFRLCGLPSGSYTIRFQAKGYSHYSQENIPFEPARTIYLKIRLNPEGKTEISSSPNPPLLDFSNCISQTILDKSQIQNTPSARNIWSLVENQDLSATTNRIDVGGLWTDIPALFSSRGGCSWTQNIYLLNELDVTDPYWTGMPLFIPDLFTLRFTQLINAGHPPHALAPGAYFNLVSQEGTSEYHGGISTFYIDKKLRSSNISPALEKEGMYESHTFNYYLDSNFHLSGPLIKDKLFFFTSWKTLHLSRDLADYKGDDKASLYSGFLSLKYRLSQNTLRFLWTGQVVFHPTYGAGRSIPYSATTNQKNFYNVFQFIWNFNPQEINSFTLGFCFNQGKINSDSQKGVKGQPGLEIFKKIPSGPAPFAFEDDRSSMTFFLKGKSLVTNFLKASHLFQYGIQLQYARSSSKKSTINNLHLRFFEGKPLEIIKYNTPLNHQESAFHLNLFAQDSLTFFNFLSVYCGLHLAYSRGWGSPQEKNRINWLNLSPRLGLVFPLSKSKTTALKISAARYYFTLPLYLLTYGHPNALGGLVYTWQDANNDRLFQDGEATALIRREGPFFARIDPELKRPYVNELSVSFVHVFGSGWYFSFGGFWRESRNLIQTLNIGVPFSAYDPVEFYDSGDDRIPGTHDDLFFTVHNQRGETLGQDFFLLTNPEPEKLTSNYQGLDLILTKKYGSKFNFFLSITATRATGTTSPGNTEWENDDSLVGSLYNNPNTLINARGRMRFDRAYTARMGFSYLAPFNIRIGCIIKYYDGQPFTRKIIVSGMNQGPFFIQAFPRGVARYEYNRTVDVRIEKIFHWGKGKLKIILDGFNILNRGLATEENEWTGPEFPLRFATEIQSPRIFRLGLAYEF